MGTFDLIEIFQSLLKRIKLIIVVTLVTAIASYCFAVTQEDFTAKINLRYTFENAKEGKAPNGNKMDTHAILNPSIISNALKNMDSDLTVEKVRNKLSVAEVIDPKTAELMAAATEKGEEFVYYPTQYTISFSYPASYGTSFGNIMLYNIAQAYDDDFVDRYYNKTGITNFLKDIDVENTDYMPLCELMETNLDNIISELESLSEANPKYRCTTTGLSFQTASSYFKLLKELEYGDYYANVREGLLTKDKSKFISTYKHKIEATTLIKNIAADESTLSKKKMDDFYNQYKSALNFTDDTNSQVENKDKNDNDNKDIVYNIDYYTLINTYDDIMLRYVNKGVEASNLTQDINFYNTLLKEFSEDTVPAAVKKDLLEANKTTLSNLSEKLDRYVGLANETINAYYREKVASDIQYPASISVTSNLNKGIVVAIGAGIGLLGTCAACLFAAILMKLIEKKKMEKASNLLHTRSENDVSKMLDDMKPLEKAFYDQTLEGFDEFSMAFEPILDKNFKWCAVESMARWNSHKFGKVTPEEFLEIAQKYSLESQLTTWSVKSVCEYANQLDEKGIDGIVISVNCSVKELENDTFVDNICSIIAKTGVDATRICFEVSGGGEITDLEYIKQKFVTLKALGAKIVIDRFGDTISSMRVLYELPIDLVKISKKYVNSLHEETFDPFLLQVIGLCKQRNIPSCINGIETLEQAETFKRLGLDFFQGYHFANPLSFDEFVETVLEQRVESKSSPNDEEGESL